MVFERKGVSTLILTLLLTSMLTVAFNIQPVRASGTIYIQADGSINPPNAPIITSDNVTYRLTGDITDSSWEAALVIQRSNIVFDGAGYTIQGSGTPSGTGIMIQSGVHNVAVRNTEVTNKNAGIWLDPSSSYNSISGNNFVSNDNPITLSSSSYNSICGNSFTANNLCVIYLESSSDYNNVSGNTLIANPGGNGIGIDSSSYDTISGNTVTGNCNYDAICLGSSSNCILCGNNVTANSAPGITLMSSVDNCVCGNNVTANNDSGIALWSSSNNNVSWNYLARNLVGIWFDSSSSNIVCGNDVTANNDLGIYLYSSSNNTVSSNNVSESYWGDILFDSSSNNIVCGNDVTATNYSGIELDYSSSNNVWGNDVTANYGVGIYLWVSSNNNVFENYLAGNLEGICLDSSPGNILRQNRIDDNTYCMEIVGSELDYYIQSIDTSNLINGKPVYYYTNQKNLEINPVTQPSFGYLAFVNCTNISVKNLMFTGSGQGILFAGTSDSTITESQATDNDRGVCLACSSNDTVSNNNLSGNDGYGVLVYYSSFNTISDNNVTENGYGSFFSGIDLYDSSYNTVSGNNVTRNSDEGIRLSFSFGNTMSDNYVNENGYGMWLNGSSSNVIYHNNYASNSQDVYSENSTNTWDNGYPSGGNYWSDYHGTDLYSGPGQNLLGSDGIGDTPYVIDSNNIDNYPLMNPWSSTPLTYTVTFTESGLAQGAQWSVHFEGQYVYDTFGSTSSSITFFYIPNGVYSFSVESTGYTASPASGSINVSGAGITEPITFSVAYVATTWYPFDNSYSAGNPGTIWSTGGNCYGLSSTAVLYFMHYAKGNTTYPCFPSQDSTANSTSSLILSGYDKLNNVSLAVMFHQVFDPNPYWSNLPVPSSVDENVQYSDLFANLTVGQPVVLGLGRAAEGSWPHAVVAFGVGPAIGKPPGSVSIVISDPNHPQDTTLAIYNLVTHSFSYGGYDRFYVIDPATMLPRDSWAKNWDPSTGEWWNGNYWLNCSVQWYDIVVANTNVTITSNGLQDKFTASGDSSTFSKEIPDSSGIEEVNFQVYAIPNSTSFSIIDPASDPSTILITRVDNESGQLVGYGCLLNVSTTQGSLNYTMIPSSSSLSISTGDNGLNASVTFFSATEQGYSVSQVLNVTVDAMQTVNLTAFHVTNVVPLLNTVCDGNSLPVNVTIVNPADVDETVNVTLYANNTAIGELDNVVLTGGVSTTVAFTWNTSMFLEGDYTISAHLETVSGETYATNSTYVGGTVQVIAPPVSGGGRYYVD